MMSFAIAFALNFPHICKVHFAVKSERLIKIFQKVPSFLWNDFEKCYRKCSITKNNTPKIFFANNSGGGGKERIILEIVLGPDWNMPNIICLKELMKGNLSCYFSLICYFGNLIANDR